MLVVDFNKPGEADTWWSVDDGVMGGVSHSHLRIADGIAIFEGHTSLDNGGGFASVRRQPAPYGLEGCLGIRLSVRGDGRTYQLRLRAGALPEGAAYRARFTTANGEWIHVALDWPEFDPVFRGRLLSDAPALAPADIQQIGVLIADQCAGDFRLEIASIEAIAAPV